MRVTSVATIDRIAPTLEPDQPVLMHQNWHHLLFLHWEVSPQELQPLVPPELTIDTFDGIAYVGLIPFTLSGVRPVGVPPLPWVSSFHECNVRTYVHRDGRDPGVWFFSLEAANSLAVRLARGLWHLPYFRADRALAGDEVETRYRSVRRWPAPVPATFDARWRVGPALGPAT